MTIRKAATAPKTMREKELRLAVICYGGISLAVYMHGITKEIWRLACASRSFHDNVPSSEGSQKVYQNLLHTISKECNITLRVLVDILAGASAGGINAIFLAEAISTGKPLDPLTNLWLEKADVDTLIDPDVSPVSRIFKAIAIPFAWAFSTRHGKPLAQTVEPAHRDEIRKKLANFVRARWLNPPFGGTLFINLLIDAFETMMSEPTGPALLPDYQPLDLFVTVTDYHGYPQRLQLHSPAETTETEHRLTLSFRDSGEPGGRLAAIPELVFAARATASFPGAFPPFRVGELDKVLQSKKYKWPERAAFLKRVLPHHYAVGGVEDVVLIDGSVLANAPFKPAINALLNRPARREVDRRFVYIDPKPGVRSVHFTSSGENGPPGFFATLFAALSDIPREQPIRDNLETIEQRSARIRRLRRITQVMRPQVELAIEHALGQTFLLHRPTPKRLAAWRSKAQNIAAREAGYAYAAYGHLKIAAVVEDLVRHISRLGGYEADRRIRVIRHSLWSFLREKGISASDAATASGAKPVVIEFFRNFDVGFRTRRLRFVARIIGEVEEAGHAPRDTIELVRKVVYELIGLYRAITVEAIDPKLRAQIKEAREKPEALLNILTYQLRLKAIDDEADQRLATALGALPAAARRTLILAYLGFPFYDIVTLPLYQGEGLDEFDPIKVDRISPNDATTIRKGGAAATLKGIQFNSFGAFFSRAYRENDYLWGRLHGAERLIDIVVSALPEGKHLPPGTVANLKREAFHAILASERTRLRAIQPLFDAIEKEIG